ncbi:class I SAM-dependent methyltransferase [Saccharopolyspora flava]|uniref:Methyltransferase domain-containing protein n=1 Tax=Saccharopolyspora flava TaxID=95161 RepID=A0A1I6QJS2_9PSEU|nr:class I SAM-dependent methyltransferase [Saccharopolyspora flava]SFS52709.1 Methyltransferase domain-containing protein [Saccharopolyspora flava]
MTGEYHFRTASDLGREQTELLQEMLDEPTHRLVEPAARPGARCLEIGAGSGSIARWLAERGASVVAVDLDTEHLTGLPGVTVLQHDINDGVPPGGPFDLIHARAVLMHLQRREHVLRELAGALAPGGMLALGEVALHNPPRVLAAPEPGDVEVFLRVLGQAKEAFSGANGMSFDWGFEVDGHLAAGLADVRSRLFSEPLVGGSTQGRYVHNLAVQLSPGLLARGAAEADLDRFCSLFLDPGFRCWYLQFVFSSGVRN